MLSQKFRDGNPGIDKYCTITHKTQEFIIIMSIQVFQIMHFTYHYLSQLYWQCLNIWISENSSKNEFAHSDVIHKNYVRAAKINLYISSEPTLFQRFKYTFNGQQILNACVLSDKNIWGLTFPFHACNLNINYILRFLWLSIYDVWCFFG